VIVVDASAAVDYLLAAGAFDQIAARFASPAESLHAPHLLDVEVAHALRRLAMSRPSLLAVPTRRSKIWVHCASDAIRTNGFFRGSGGSAQT